MNPYISHLSPVVGNGLGGLPRRYSRGEAIFVTPGIHNWVVPNGVTSVCVVCIAPGGSSNAQNSSVGGDDSYFKDDYSLYARGGYSGGVSTGRDGSTLGKGIGGGDGGLAGYNGGGGAGGYLGNGGSNGGNGSGGGGASEKNDSYNLYCGGGTGLFGVGTSGVNGGIIHGSIDVAKNHPLGSQAFGGGSGYYANSGGGGGGLRWKNDIQVSPGQIIVIRVGVCRIVNSASNHLGMNGAVRVIWGPGVSFPYNAAW